jgi:hypothetical protein
MTLFGWFKQKDRGPGPALRHWRVEWARLLEGPGIDDERLREALHGLAASEPDVELETEMLDALDALRAAQRQLADGALPVVETHHRVIGADRCHFTAPACLPADQAQPAGRVLLGGSRAIFVGGGRTAATPWHAVRQVLRSERDVLLVRGDGTAAAHYRFNTYGDAIVCAFLAGQLGPEKRKSL